MPQLPAAALEQLGLGEAKPEPKAEPKPEPKAADDKGEPQKES